MAPGGAKDGAEQPDRSTEQIGIGVGDGVTAGAHRHGHGLRDVRLLIKRSEFVGERQSPDESGHAALATGSVAHEEPMCMAQGLPRCCMQKASRAISALAKCPIGGEKRDGQSERSVIQARSHGLYAPGSG